MAKRKRESDAVTGKSSGSTSPAPAENISPASLKGKGKAKETTSKDDGAGRKVEVVWELADGSGRWTKPITHVPLEREKMLEDILPRIARKLHLPSSEMGAVRLVHMRDGGREVEIYDNFDFQAFKDRALASTSGTPFVVKVYPAAGSSANSVASSSTAHEVVKDVAEKVAKRREKKQSVKIPAGTGIGEQEPTMKGKERSKKENLKAAPTLVPLEEDQSQPSLPPMLQPAPPMSDSTPLPKVKPKKKVKLAVPGSDPPYTPSPASSSSLPSKASSRTLPSQPSQPSAQPTTAGTSLSSAAAIAAVPSKKISSKSAETPAPHLADGPATPMKESSLPLDSTTSRKRPRSTPSPDSSPASTAKQATQHVKKKKRTSDDPVPYSASPAPTVSDAASPAPIIPNADAIVQKVLHSLIQRFKPSVPSPLSKASEMTPKAPEMTPSSSTPVNREKVKRLRRTRKKSSASALPTPLILAAVESEFSPAKVAVDLRETSSGRTTPQPWSLSEPRHFFNRLSEKDSTPERSSSSFDEVSPNMKRNKRRSRNSEQEVRQSEEANERQSTGDSREGRPDSEVVEAGPEKIEGAGDDSVSDVLADSGRDLSGGSNEKAQEAPPIVEPPISKKTVKRKPKQKVGTAEIAPHDVVIPTASNAARSSSAAATTPPASSPVPETLPSETAEPCIPARVAKPVKASRKSTPASSGALEKKRIMDAYRAKLAAQQATSGTEAARSVSSPDPPFEATAPAAVSHAAQASFSRAEGKREESPQPTAIVSDATGSREAEKTFSDKAISPASEVSSMEPTPDVPTPAAVRPKRKTQKPVEPEVPPANQADNYNDETPAHTSQVGALNPSARPEVRTEPTLAESSVAALPKRQPQMPLKKNEVKAMERARSEGQAASVPSDVTPVEPERMAPVIFPEGQTEARASPSLDESEIGPPMPADKRKGRPSKVPPQMVPPDVSRPELPDESWTTPVENVQEVPSVVGDAVQPTATSPSTHMPALPPRASSITASESTSNPSVGVPNRSRQTSAQLPEIRGKSVTAQHARLARRVACIICDEVPTHLQKDCPRVKAGLESLQDLLEEREDEEPSDTTEASIQAIKAWIDRLTTIRKKVMGLEGGQVARSVSPNRAAPKLAMAKLQGNHAVQQEMATAADPATNAVNGKTGQARDPTPPLPITTDRTKHSEAIQPVSPANDRSTTPFHPLYLKALSRPRTAGSLSGLSASDAVIETGGSDQGSSGDESEGGDPSVEDDDYSHSKETAYSVESGSDNESASGSDEEDGSDESATTETESLPSDGSDLAKILTKPLSERQKRAARESAASIQHFDLTMPPDDDNSDIVGSDSDDEQDVRKGGSDSSIADFGEAEDESKASEASEIRTLARPPELAAKSNTSSPQSHRSSRSFAAIDDHAGESPAVDEFEGAVALREAIDEEDRPEREAMAGILVEESADKDEAPRSHIISQGLPSPPSSHDNDFFPEIIPTQLASGMDVDHSPSVSKRSTRPNKALLAPPIELDRPTSDRRLRSASRETTGEPSQLFRGYRSPVLDSSPTVAGNASSRPTRTTRTSVERSPLASQSMRTSNTSSPQSAAVRSIKTAKEPSQQSSTSRKASPGATLDIDGGRGSKTPSRSNPRRSVANGDVRSSQVDQLDSSQPRQPSPVQEEPSQYQIKLCRTTRTRESPLFMTQPSQAQEMQAYNAFPSSDPPEQQHPFGDLPRPGANGHLSANLRVSSPILEEEDDASRSPSPSPLPNGHSARSSSCSHDDTVTVHATKIYPQLPRHQSSSQPSSMFPSLSSLPKDLLRIGRSAMPTAKGTLSQAPPRRTEDSSEESESSSSEDDVPPGLEGRFAGGRGRKKAKTGGSMSGW